MGEIKQASFRLGDDTIEKFKELAVELGYNQADMFNNLLSTFELARARCQIVDRGKEIEAFEVTANTLVSMFVNSLSVNQTAEETIRIKLNEEINMKDTTIRDLQEQQVNFKAETVATKENAEILEKQNKEFTSELGSLKIEFLQKNNTINSQLDQISTLNSIVSEYKKYKDINVEVETKNKVLLSENLDAKHKNIDLENKFKNSEEMTEFFRDEIQALKQEKAGLSEELRQTEINYKEELKVEKKTLEIKINDELSKIKNGFDEKLQFEKDKMQLEKEKLISKIDNLELKYNEAVIKIENNKIKINDNKETKQV